MTLMVSRETRPIYFSGLRDTGLCLGRPIGGDLHLYRGRDRHRLWYLQSVTCNAIGSGSATVSGTLTMSTGLSGTYAARSMKSGANSLHYNIYLTPSYTQAIGDGSAGTYAPSESGTVTAGQQYQVTGNMYGFMPASQDVPAGNYSDSIFVTVTY
jgi:spore coat protein U-like protein